MGDRVVFQVHKTASECHSFSVSNGKRNQGNALCDNDFSDVDYCLQEENGIKSFKIAKLKFSIELENEIIKEIVLIMWWKSGKSNTSTWV